MQHTTITELEEGLDEIRRSPADGGTVELIVRRPAVDEREVLEEGGLDLSEGLVGDSWSLRKSKSRPDGSPHPDMQLNIMNARAIGIIAGDRGHWPLAGDQFYVDLDLSEWNLPPGTRLALGTAVIEVTDQAHTGCKKFSSRFGLDALRFVNSKAGKELHLRGINAKVVQPGRVRHGDAISKLGD